MTPAIALLLSGAIFTIAHTSVKFIPHIPTAQIVFFRAIFSIVLSYIWLRYEGIRPWGKNKPMLILRGVVGTGSLFLYIYTLKHMPLASAFALNYLTPIFTVLISWFVLKEKPQWHIWLFLALSFCGVLLVRGFDARISGTELAAGIGSAMAAACAYTLVRKLRNEDHPLVVVFFFPLVTLPLTLPFYNSTWILPNAQDWFVIAVIGICTQLAQYFMTVAYQGAPAASITNLTYVTIVYALAIGFFFFDETFSGGSLTGIALIIMSAVLSSHVTRKKAAIQASVT
jgi:drug/metabolite transporter (DMT)-like permease